MKSTRIVSSVLLLVFTCIFSSGCHAMGWHGMCMHTSQSPSRPASLSKCSVCAGIGYKKDPNSGRQEMCNYCNGTGLR